MPGLLKIGESGHSPLIRPKQLFTTGVPTPFKIEFAKKVKDYKAKERTLHTLISQYRERVWPRREFFRITVEEVRCFFDLMDGEWWVDPRTEADVEEEEIEEEESISETESVPQPTTSSRRDMTKCFTNGQRIRHKIGINKIWIGTYDASRNEILCDGTYYKTLSTFALKHHNVDNPGRVSANGWAECEYEVDGEWKNTFTLSA